jgi:hypothetical protein
MRRGVRELALFGAAYVLYNAGRGVTSGNMDLALTNAQWVLDFQGGDAVEHAVQDTFTGVWMTLLSHIYLAAQIVILPGVRSRCTAGRRTSIRACAAR